MPPVEEEYERKEAVLSELPWKPNGRAGLPEEVKRQVVGSQRLPQQYAHFEVPVDESQVRKVQRKIAGGLRNTHGTMKEKFDRSLLCSLSPLPFISSLSLSLSFFCFCFFPLFLSFSCFLFSSLSLSLSLLLLPFLLSLFGSFLLPSLSPL